MEDISKLYSIYQNPNIVKYIQKMDVSLEEEQRKQEAYIQYQYCFYGYGLWGVFERKTNELIGRCGLQNCQVDGKIEVELGYVIEETYWHRGYALDACQFVLQYAFSELCFERVIAMIQVENKASIRLAKRLGMKLEKQIEEKGSLFVIYVKDRDEFQNNN